MPKFNSIYGEVEFWGEGYSSGFILNGNQRQVQLTAGVRIHKWKWLYEGFAKDMRTGIIATSKYWKSENGAKEHAIEVLIGKLITAGHINN